MNAMQKIISLRSFFLSVLGLVVGAVTMLVAGPGMAADETFTQTATITVPGGLTSFDIGFVDPKLGFYFLADRTNKTIDKVKTSDNSITQLVPGELVGPNGVITANDHTEVWEGDTDSKVRVISLATATGTLTHTIDTGGVARADELCEDPSDHLVLVANDEPQDLFITFISTTSYAVVGKISLNGTDPKGKKINATNGIEQCQWDLRTKKFYLAIPEVNGNGLNSQPGAVLVINPKSMIVEKVRPIDFGFLAASGTTPATADCLGPQGVTIGPNHEILLGCSNAGAGSVIIDERSGAEHESLPGLNGNDEVWYNPGDNHYFLAGSNHKGSKPISGPILGVVDQKADTGDPEDAPAVTLKGSHSVAADPVKNQVYVPVNAGANALCGALSTTGCIAVFTAANDDPGLCSSAKPVHGHGHGGPNGDALFLASVCP